MVITVECPSCSASFPVDPNKIPEAGVKARCSSCAHVFRVERPAPVEDLAPGAGMDEALPEPEAALPELEAAPSGHQVAPSEPEVAAPEPEVAAPEPEAPAEDADGDDLVDEPDDWVIENDEAPALADEAPAGSAESSFFGARPSAVEEPAAPVDELPSFGEVPAEEPAEELPSFGEPAAEDPTDDLPGFDAPVLEEPAAQEAPGEEAPKVQGFTFGKRDPKDKAKRLARVLVSDMISYNPDRHQKAVANGTIKEDFEDEIEKSWKEYVEQVGAEMAETDGQDFWREALNDVLAKGERLF